jgi:predicted permease
MIMRNILLDLRFALRSLAKAPIFTAVAVLSLAFGIGANTAIFSLLDQLLLRPLPIREPATIFQMAARGSHYGSNWGRDCMSFPMYRDFRDKLPVHDGLLARRSIGVNLGFRGQVERAAAEIVTGNYFQVLGIQPVDGRVFTQDDDRTPLGHPVAVLSYGYWQARFGGDRAVIGTDIVVNNHNFKVVGVTQPGFTGLQLGTAAQLFLPMTMQDWLIPMPDTKLLEDRRTRFVNVFGRLKPGMTVERAQAAAAPLFQQIISEEIKEKAFAKADKESIGRFLQSKMTVFEGGAGMSGMRREYGPALWILMSLVGVVLLIACANVANLQLARAMSRQKEVAVRLSVGASRGQIVRQLLIESVLMALVAGALGLAIGHAASIGLLAMQPSGDTPTNVTANLDPRVLLFTFGVSLLTGVLFGLVPAFQSANPDLASTLKEQAGSVVGGTHAGFRKALVALQVTLSLLLLIGAGLFAQSLTNLRTLDPGFRPSRLLMFTVDLNSAGYPMERAHTFSRQLAEQLRALPGVEAASSATMPLVSGDEWDSSITVEGQDPAKGSSAWAFMNHPEPGYFQAIGAPLVAGRDFDARDTLESKKVAIVNQQFVREYFPDKDPIGRRIGMGSDPGTQTDIEIVGVVKDFKYQDIHEKTGRQLYQPYAQMKFVTGRWFYARTSGDPEAMFNAIRNEVRKIDANVPITGLRTVEQQVDRNLSTKRLVANLSVCFGVLATLLAVLGLYGVMAYLVGRRSREIGIRIALGANSTSVVTMILKEVMLLVGIGLAVGLAGALGLGSFVRAQLYGVAPNDPKVLALATLLLGAVALFAGWMPANRASRTDPTRVLRYE